MSDPLPVLEYRTPDPKRPRAISLKSLLAFAAAFETALMLIWFFDGNDPLVPMLIFSSIGTLITTLVLLVTTWARSGLASRPLRSRGSVLSLALGVGCIVAPSLIRTMLLGVTETIPWALTTWFAGVVAASFVLYPPIPSPDPFSG